MLGVFDAERLLNYLRDRLRKEFVSTAQKDLYAIAANELDQGAADPGLWAKAIADADGSRNKAQAYYLRMRVTELIAEREQIEQERHEESLRQQQQRYVESLPKRWDEVSPINQFIAILLAVAGGLFLVWLIYMRRYS